MFRLPNYEPWNMEDDPSYNAQSRNGYAEASGVALLDEEGNLLNEWACFDSDGPAIQARKEARVLASDEKMGSNTASTLKLVVENTGGTMLDGFELRYYLRDNSGNVQVSAYDAEGASVSMNDAGGNLHFVSVVYKDTKLNPGEKVDYGNGVKFELHYPNWAEGFDASDDPSHYNITGWGQVVADSVVLLDLGGNLIWGKVPKPEFDGEYEISQPERGIVFRDNDNIYVDIDEEGHYILEVVNAASVPVKTLFNGYWEAGEHVVNVSNYTFASNTYLVLKKDKKIIYWNLYK